MNCVFCCNTIISKYYCVYCGDYFNNHKISECHSCHQLDSMGLNRVCDSCNIMYPVYTNINIIEFYFNKDLSTIIWSPWVYSKANYICTYTINDNIMSINNLSKSNIANSQAIGIKFSSSEELFSYSRKLLKLTEYL